MSKETLEYVIEKELIATPSCSGNGQAGRIDEEIHC